MITNILETNNKTMEKELIQEIERKIDKCLSILNTISWNQEVKNDNQFHPKNRTRIHSSN